MNVFMPRGAGRQDVVRAWDNLKRIDGEYGTRITQGRSAEKVFHDLGVMAAHGDLKQMGAELVDPNRAVLLRYVQTLPAVGRGWQSAPQIDPRRVGNGVLLARGGSRIREYRQHLALKWGATEKTPEPPADTFATGPGEQVRVTTGGRTPLVVTRSGTRGFAFAEVVGMPGLKPVYLHCTKAPPGFAFVVGRQLTAVVVRVAPDPAAATDLQGWAIRPA